MAAGVIAGFIAFSFRTDLIAMLLVNLKKERFAANSWDKPAFAEAAAHLHLPNHFQKAVAIEST
jgi:hypothetical protein